MTDHLIETIALVDDDPRTPKEIRDEVGETLRNVADAAVILHEPGQFTNEEVALTGLGPVQDTYYVGGKRIRVYSLLDEI